jgi:hypothetical protein
MVIFGRVIVWSAYAVPEPLPMIAPEGQPAGPPRSSLLSEQLGYRAPLYCDPVGNHKSNPVTIGSCARESPPQPNDVVSRTPPGLSTSGAALACCPVVAAKATAPPTPTIKAAMPAAANLRIVNLL